MATTDNTSKSLHYIQVLERQPGIDENMTLKQIKEILSNEEKAAKIDSQLESPFYNQAKLSFQRLNKTGRTVLMTCKPTSIKLFLTLAHYQNQSNIICISRADLTKIAEMSKPTINAASEELISKGLMIIERGDEGQGEAITYILNPEVITSGKIIYQKNLIYHYWERAGEDAKRRFDNILKHAEAQFSSEFQIEDTTIRGEVEPQAKIIKKGKEINQRKNKKRVSADQNTDPKQQDITSPTSQNHYKQNEPHNSSPFKDNMTKAEDLLTSAERKLFAFETDPEVPFN
jgi:hypothetical protein